MVVESYHKEMTIVWYVLLPTKQLETPLDSIKDALTPKENSSACDIFFWSGRKNLYLRFFIIVTIVLRRMSVSAKESVCIVTLLSVEKALVISSPMELRSTSTHTLTHTHTGRRNSERVDDCAKRRHRAALGPHDSVAHAHQGGVALVQFYHRPLRVRKTSREYLWTRGSGGKLRANDEK